MGATYEIARIGAEQIDQAYPLAILAVPTLSAEAWRKLCGDVVEREGHGPELDDVVIATNPRNYIHGLSVSAVCDHALLGKVLDVPIFAIATAVDEAGVATAMIEYLNARALQENCANVRIWGASTKDDWTRSLTKMAPWENGVLLPLQARSEGKAQDLPVKT